MADAGPACPGSTPRGNHRGSSGLPVRRLRRILAARRPRHV